VSAAKHDWEFHAAAMHAIFQDQGEDGVQRYWKQNRLSRFFNTTCAIWMRENWEYLTSHNSPQLSDADFLERLLDLFERDELRRCRFMWLRRGGQRTFGFTLTELRLVGGVQRDRGLKISDLQLGTAAPAEPIDHPPTQSAYPEPPKSLRSILEILGKVWDDDDDNERRRA